MTGNSELRSDITWGIVFVAMWWCFVAIGCAHITVLISIAFASPIVAAFLSIHQIGRWRLVVCGPFEIRWCAMHLGTIALVRPCGFPYMSPHIDFLGFDLNRRNGYVYALGYRLPDDDRADVSMLRPLFGICWTKCIRSHGIAMRWCPTIEKFDFLFMHLYRAPWL